MPFLGDKSLLETPYGITQVTEGLDSKKIQEIETNMSLYMEKFVQNEMNPKYDEVRDRCKNTKPECFKLKAEGKCTGSVETECAPVCETCELLDHKHWCPMDEGVPPALKPGDLHLLFERIVTEEYYQEYEPKVLSMPATNADMNTTIGPDGCIITDGPWLILLDNFLTADECRHMQVLANEQNLHPIPVYVFRDYRGNVVSKVNNACNARTIRCETDCAERITCFMR
ncbi:ShK toxin domain [Fragilaria crotonensis]|nr:ShK toxin domain [Fragilaria crotonensis]